MKKSNNSIPYQWFVSKRLARILAHLMGDGCVAKYIRYHNKEQALLNQFKTDFVKLFGNVHFTEGMSNSGTSFVNVQNKRIREILFKLHKDYRSEKIEIPKQILLSGKPIKKEFLKAFFDDEGCATMKFCQTSKEIKCAVQLTSKSLKILRQIKKLLEKEFSITCNKLMQATKITGNKKFITWMLAITGKENLIRFTDEINFYHPRKIENLNQIKAYYVIRKGQPRNVYIFSLLYNYVSGHRSLETPKPIPNLEQMWQKSHLQES